MLSNWYFGLILVSFFLIIELALHFQRKNRLHLLMLSFGIDNFIYFLLLFISIYNPFIYIIFILCKIGFLVINFLLIKQFQQSKENTGINLLGLLILLSSFFYNFFIYNKNPAGIYLTKAIIEFSSKADLKFNFFKFLITLAIYSVFIIILYDSYKKLSNKYLHSYFKIWLFFYILIFVIIILCSIFFFKSYLDNSSYLAIDTMSDFALIFFRAAALLLIYCRPKYFNNIGLILTKNELIN